jgi:hypothetical protein
MSAKSIACPDCGLVIKVASDAEKSTLLYDFSEWQARCQRLDLEGPAWCLIRRDATSPKNSTK